MINYRDLLKRYIKHVRQVEGTTLINLIRPPGNPDWCDLEMTDLAKHWVRFSEEEIEELHCLSEKTF